MNNNNDANNPYYTTSFNPSGNRWIKSCGPSQPRSLVSTNNFVLDTSLSSAAEWVVGTDQSLQFVVLTNNRQQVRLDFNNNTTTTTTNPYQSKVFLPDASSSTRPLIVIVDQNNNNNNESLLNPIVPPTMTSPWSAAVPLPDDCGGGGGWLLIDANQNRLKQLRSDGTDVTTPSVASIVDPLVDAHIVYSRINRLWAVYASSTNQRYVHGILGDNDEGYRLHVLQCPRQDGLVRVATSVTLQGNDMVFEGLGPQWADMNGDGVEDLLTTVAASGEGAALRVYFVNQTTTTTTTTIAGFAQSAYIGTSDRWLHQLAVGPLGPRGETEIVEIRTPHIGGRVRYYRYNAALNRLDHVATARSEYTSHDIGSRNIDQAVVADVNGDGILELVVQNQEETRIFGLQRCTEGSVGIAWQIDTPGRMSSNIGIACNNDNNKSNGEIHLLFGTSNNRYLHALFRPNVNTTLVGCPFSSAIHNHHHGGYNWWLMLLIVGYTTRQWIR